MNLWKDRRVDSLHRVVLPREAFSLLGWTSDEVLEAEALPAQDALLLRAQNHPRPQCCACGGAQDLVSLGGRRWLCGGPALPPRTPQTKPDLLNPPQQKAPRLIRGVQLRKHSKAREKRYSFGYAVSFIFACYQILWTFPKSRYLCSRYLPLVCG